MKLFKHKCDTQVDEFMTKLLKIMENPEYNM